MSSKSWHSIFVWTLTLSLGAALAQTPGTAEIEAAEQRRAQERATQLREQLERAPDVLGPASGGAAPQRLPANETPCFKMDRIVVGALVSPSPSAPLTSSGGVSSSAFAWLSQHLAGPDGTDSPLFPVSARCLGAQGIAIVLQRAQDALIAQGFVTSRVLAQPQDLSAGALTLTVVPGRIHAIRFAEPISPRATAWNAVPAKPGDVLNLRDIEQALENFKRVPTAEVDIKIEPAASDAPDQSDLVISYSQALPLRLSLSVDDSGSPGTGKYQGSATLNYDNWLTLNDLLYLTHNHDLGGGETGARGTEGLTLHYSLPVGYWSLATTLSSGGYFQTVAGASQDYVYRGTNESAELKLSRLIYRDASAKSTLSLKAWYRKSANFIDDTEVEVQRRAVGGWELGLSHRQHLGPATLDASLNYKRGTGAFNSQPAPEEAFGEGTSQFGLLGLDMNLNLPFKLAAQSLRWTSSLRAQDNHTPLTPQDRFAIGGRYTVRGFDGESSLSAERGWVVRNELSWSLGGSGQELYLGLDSGEVGGASAANLVGTRLSGAVLGLRGGYKGWQYELFMGGPLEKPEGFKTAALTAGFSMNYSF